MKLGFFDDFKVGVVAGDSVVDVTDVVKDISRLGPQDVMRGVIERFDALEGKLADAAAKGQGKPGSQVRFRPPLPRPENIICTAVNYMEDGTLAEPAPINAFMKSPSAIIGDGDAMVLPDMAATRFVGEAELAVVIGKLGANFLAVNNPTDDRRSVWPQSRYRGRPRVEDSIRRLYMRGGSFRRSSNPRSQSLSGSSTPFFASSMILMASAS